MRCSAAPRSRPRRTSSRPPWRSTGTCSPCWRIAAIRGCSARGTTCRGSTTTRGGASATSGSTRAGPSASRSDMAPRPRSASRRRARSGRPGRPCSSPSRRAGEPGTQVENPRQVSAYRYPPAYGPKSPSFSRGTVPPPDWGRAFFLSGTASVVGHATTHVGEPLGQLEETLSNIGALLDGPAADAGAKCGGSLRFDLLKIYLRRPEHFPAIRDALAPRLDPATVAVYLQADICRAEPASGDRGGRVPGDSRREAGSFRRRSARRLTPRTRARGGGRDPVSAQRTTLAARAARSDGARAGPLPPRRP